MKTEIIDILLKYSELCIQFQFDNWDEISKQLDTVFFELDEYNSLDEKVLYEEMKRAKFWNTMFHKMKFEITEIIEKYS